MELWHVVIAMWVIMILLIALGFPVAFSLGSVAVVGSVYVWGGINGICIIATTAADVMTNWILLSIPLFILMAEVLKASGISDDLFEVLHVWMGRVAGGLAIGTSILGAVLGAMMGAAPASTATMAGVSLDPMLKRGYDKRLALGCIAAGGALSIVIPPSILMIVYASLTGVSPGGMFAGGLIPGLVLMLVFSGFIAIRCGTKQSLGPPTTERAGWNKKLTSLVKVILPVFIITLVLGSIYAGIATPTEAAAVGAFGAIISAIIYRRFSISMIRNALQDTTRITVMIMWIVIAASAFSRVVEAAGASEMISKVVSDLALSKWVVMGMIQAVLLILGCVLDPLGIMMITIPVFLPIISALGFDPLWFGVIFIINMGVAFITPPFGFNLFVLRGMVPPSVKMGDIIAGSVPFVFLYLIGLAICMVFPGLITWLPSLMISK
jgi:tripartite ATP-independent transporter DctM subunit